jgi:hypothetical protein
MKADEYAKPELFNRFKNFLLLAPTGNIPSPEAENSCFAGLETEPTVGSQTRTIRRRTWRYP